jgi:hypothetical protein
MEQIFAWARLPEWAVPPPPQVLPKAWSAPPPPQVLPKATSALDMLMQQHQAHLRRMLPPGPQQLARERYMADLIEIEVAQQQAARAAGAGDSTRDMQPAGRLPPPCPSGPPFWGSYDDDPPPHPRTAAVANPAVAPAAAPAVAGPTAAAPAVAAPAAAAQFHDAAPPRVKPAPPNAAVVQQLPAVGIGTAANPPSPPPRRVPAVTPAVADPAVAAQAAAAPAPRGLKAGPPHILAAAAAAKAAAAAEEELARQQLAAAAANPPPAATTVGPAAAAAHPTQDGGWNSTAAAAQPMDDEGPRWSSGGGWSFDWGDLAGPPNVPDAPAAAAVQPTQGGGWSSSWSGGGWPGAWRDATWSSSEARPNTGQRLAAEWGAGPSQAGEGAWSWWWSDRFRAWMYSPPQLSPLGEWAWADGGRHALYVVLPPW